MQNMTLTMFNVVNIMMRYYYCLIIIFMANLATTSSQNKRNNVCKEIIDYATLLYNKNCWYDPDVEAPPAKIAARHGFRLDSFSVVTFDKYILSVYRLVSNKKTNTTVYQPILLQHGILVEGISWMVRGKNSPAFYLANKGYDVWIANSRGTFPSSQHLNLSIEDPEYWNFSFHEMGVYDLPAVTDFVCAKTKATLILISHSMGSTASLVYATVRNKHARKNVKALIATAPVAYMKFVRSPIKYFAPIGRLIEYTLNLLGFYGIGQYPTIQREILGKSCKIYPIIIGCELVSMAVSGVAFKEVSPQNLPAFFYNYPSGTAVKSLQHYAQIINNDGNFQYFDYDSKFNMKLYNSLSPPSYKVEKIIIPVYLMYGKNDFLAGEADVNTLFNNLKVTTKQLISVGEETGGFSHNDFLNGKNIQHFYKHLDRVLLELS